MMLADAGADVIRLERAGAAAGLGSGSWNHTHRGRPSVGCDLKHPDGRDLALRLAGSADALIEGFRPGVMERLGLGPDEVYANPIHPYTQSLLSAVPIPDPRANAARKQIVLEGDVPSPANPPPACRFHTRCPYATEVCSTEEPALVDHGGGHFAACWHPLDREGRPRNMEATPTPA